MSTQIAKPEPHAVTNVEQHTYGVDPTVQWAMQNGATPEMLRELYQLQREMRADQARQAFNAAFSAFKAEPITIVKRKEGAHKGQMYAELHEVVAVITPVLSRHQLSASWKLSKDDPTWMEVTCTIRHPLGHFEEVSMGAGPDAGPGRNAIQARASTKTYLERYTLLAATGLAAGGTDDDGIGSGTSQPKAGLSEGELIDRIEAIRAASTQEELKDVWAKANVAARKANDVAAQQQFAKEGERRRAQL